MMTSGRSALFVHLQATRFDLLVVGGGIVGAGIARDAAMRGLTVALIDQGDFASGTSSKTSKLIHGGLRYLEHGHLRLVAESLRERHVLRTIAPALAHPLSLMLPIYAGDTHSTWQVHLGLGLYDLLATGRNIRPHRMLSPRRALVLESGLRSDGLRGAGLYADCQMDDARLCLANILQAVSFGATCCNYIRLHALMKANGQVCGGIGEDVLTGLQMEIHAQTVINATGPWSDRVRQLSEARAIPRLAPTKGIHLILPRLAREALFVQARADRRMFFILPFEDYSLIGTTETGVDAPLEALQATHDEVGYLLDEVHRVIPGSHVTADDVIATFAGARPLLAFAGSSTQASREHRVEVDAAGLVSVLGGKFTTYRAMAKDVVDLVIRRVRWHVDRCLTDQVSLFEEVHPVALEQWHAVTKTIDPDLLGRMITRYGVGAFRVLQFMDQEPALAHPVCPHHEHLEAELVYAIQHELACTVTDVLARRTRIAWSSCQGLDLLSRLVELFQRYGGCSSTEMERQVEAYHRFLANGVAFRPATLTGHGFKGHEVSAA